MASYEHEKVEKEIFSFWETKKIYKKAKKKGKKKFYFLDGPPYTSGSVHIGTAWNKVLKDMVLRYKRMHGFDVWDRAGYDMHGLPIEHRVQNALKLKFKEDIVKFGVGKFMEECKKLSTTNLELMNREFERLGVWMDFENAYQTIADEFIEGVWWLVKQAERKKRLYQDYRPVPWDYVHQSALAKHELEYKSVKDKSIYVKFKVKGTNEYLVIFTTTPWTIAFNLGVMVHPDIVYTKARVKTKQGTETWIIAKELADMVIKDVAQKEYTSGEEVKGKDLEGIEYEHPFHNELQKQYADLKKDHANVHTVVLSSEYVTLDVGSGLVHMAPGCGPEDYEVGHKYDVPAWNTLEENGVYSKSMGKFSGKHAFTDGSFFIESLKECNALVRIVHIEHEYPHGQRSHIPVVFRATKQWFFRIEDVKSQLVKWNDNVSWNPQSGYNAFNSWLENLRDNSISKQRFWGTPVPIWQADDGAYLVVESRRELESLSGQKVKDMHKPWIDEIIIKKDGKTYKRIPDVLDVWIDAGSVSWNCLDFPSNDRLFKKYWPADFILEGRDQVRGWFNLLFVASMIGLHDQSFRAVYMHGMITDVEGVKMSKSLGNIISPDVVLKKYGADAFRYYVSQTNAGEDLNFSWEEIQQKHRNLLVLANTVNYSLNAGRISSMKKLELEDKYMLSKLNSTIQQVTLLMNEYRLDEVPQKIEELFFELSRVYIQLTRDRVDNPTVKKIIFDTLLSSIKMFSIITPFITEHLYQKMKKQFMLKEESVHLCDWPSIDKKHIDKKLESEFIVVKKVIQEILAQRNREKIGVRWPLKKVTITSEHAHTLKRFNKIIQYQTNVKSVTLVQGKGDIAIVLETKLTPELEREGYCREVMRAIQSMRKKAGLQKSERINLMIHSAYDISRFKKEIQQKVGAKSVIFKQGKEVKHTSTEKVKDQVFELGFSKAK